MLRTSEIRAQFPNPQSLRMAAARSANEFMASYCVGGAVCAYCAQPETMPRGFPDTWSIAIVLMEANPCLPSEQAQNMAYKIVYFNDQTAFEKAWEVVDLALTYAPVENIEAVVDEPVEELVGA